MDLAGQGLTEKFAKKLILLKILLKLCKDSGTLYLCNIVVLWMLLGPNLFCVLTLLQLCYGTDSPIVQHFKGISMFL